MDFYTVVTSGGKSKITRSLAQSTILELTSFAVGDGGDGYYDPDVEQTELMNETYRGKISKIYVDKEYENRLIVECAIPSDSGGYYIRGYRRNSENRLEAFATTARPVYASTLQRHSQTNSIPTMISFTTTLIQMRN